MMKPFTLVAFVSSLALLFASAAQELRVCSDDEIRHIQDQVEGPQGEECANHPSFCDSVACKTSVEQVLDAFPDDCYIPEGVMDYRNLTQQMVRDDAIYYCPHWDL